MGKEKGINIDSLCKNIRTSDDKIYELSIINDVLT